MADPKLFCPSCGAQQLKADARFCHVCGQPLPTPLPYAGRGEADQPPPPSQGGGRGVGPQGGGRGIGLWLIPFILALAVMAAAVVAWQRGLLDLGGRGRAAWTPAALSERAVGGPSTLGEPGDAGSAATPTAGFPAATLAPPSPTLPPPPIATPQATATPRPTATPPPTATPLPTATPAPTPAPVVARTNGNVNVRSGPGTAYPILAQVPAGTTFVVQGQNSAGTWWQVCCLREKPGWVLAELLSATGPMNVPVVADIPPPPDPGRVVFVSDRNGYAHLFMVDGNGNGLRAVTGGNEYFWDPVLSNDGSRLAFVSKAGGNTEIFVANRDGSNRRPISNHPAEDDHPAWFPGNNALAFASRRDGAWEIYRMNADGSNVRRLTWDGGDNRFVAVSPDGGQIAYVSQNAGYPGIDLMIMDADGGNRRVLYSYASRRQRDDPGRFLYRPDWSPDGTRIAFGVDDDDDGLISVLVIDVATGQAQRLIRDGNGPAWSPDGERLIYKPFGERQILFVADAAGNQLYRLTGSDYNAWSPDWAR